MKKIIAASLLLATGLTFANNFPAALQMRPVSDKIFVNPMLGPGEGAAALSISSTKSQLGHLLGASGGVELIFALLAIRDQVVPPTINLENPDPKCDLDYTPNTPRERRIQVAMSNSFGFGGHNGTVVVGSLR